MKCSQDIDQGYRHLMAHLRWEDPLPRSTHMVIGGGGLCSPCRLLHQGRLSVLVTWQLASPQTDGTQRERKEETTALFMTYSWMSETLTPAIFLSPQASWEAQPTLKGKGISSTSL